MLHVRIDVPPYPPMLEALAEGLVLLNVEMMRYAAERGADIPSLYDSGIRYRREPEGREWWESASDMLNVVTDRSGDCEDLAGFRAAELRFQLGEPARVVIVPTRKGGFHAKVERGDGSLEDPSLILLHQESEETGVPVQSLAELRTQDTRYAA